MAKADLPPVPAALADVAFIDGPTCAAAGGMSLSSWHELVRIKEAPQPAIRQPRCTRWRLADVRAWLVARASREIDQSGAVIANARKASAASVAKRRGTLEAVGATGA
jgi:predicted DNA-binding transcriptional regulator AlpA